MMKVLHVSLGLPPLRTGGLTRYCTELMEAQMAVGDEVCLLYPGHFLPGDMRIEQRKWKNITTFEIVNPLPVALTYGVAGALDYMVPCDKGVYEGLLSVVKPDVVHVHSTMGIHREFFEIAKEMGIPLVYTTHDYYLVCPRCTFINSRGFPCTYGASGSLCARCNTTIGMTLNKSKIMQSHVYARLKRSKLVRMVGSVVKRKMSSDNLCNVGTETTDILDVDVATQEAYSNLLSYNVSIAKLFDVLICNSTSTQTRFQTYLPNAKTFYLPITHGGLKHLGMSCKVFATERPLAIGYFGGYKAYKGFDVLMAASALLEAAGIDYELHLYGGDYPAIFETPNHIIEGTVDSSQVQTTMSGLDLIVVPSIWPETFGFIVLEAICAGVPVICSDIVGASDLVAPEYTFESGNSQKLFECIVHLQKSGRVLVGLPNDYPISMDEQVERLAHIYSAHMSGAPNE